jgi:hypothetical protein
MFLLSNILLHLNNERTSEEINRLIKSMTDSKLKQYNINNLTQNANVVEEFHRLKTLQNKLNNTDLSDFLLNFN